MKSHSCCVNSSSKQNTAFSVSWFDCQSHHDVPLRSNQLEDPLMILMISQVSFNSNLIKSRRIPPLQHPQATEGNYMGNQARRFLFRVNLQAATMSRDETNEREMGKHADFVFFLHASPFSSFRALHWNPHFVLTFSSHIYSFFCVFRVELELSPHEIMKVANRAVVRRNNWYCCSPHVRQK